MPSGGSRREPADDLRQDRRVRRNVLEPCLRAIGSLVGERAGAVDAVREHVAVAVEDVVDDLEQETELVAERPPRRLLALRHLRDPERQPDARAEEAPGL